MLDEKPQPADATATAIYAAMFKLSGSETSKRKKTMAALSGNRASTARFCCLRGQYGVCDPSLLVLQMTRRAGLREILQAHLKRCWMSRKSLRTRMSSWKA